MQQLSWLDEQSAPVKRDTSVSAGKMVIEGMRACLPKDCPLGFTVVSAKFIKGRVKKATAEVKMFDGLPGTLEVSQEPFGRTGFLGWGLHWKDLPGGAINWNGTNWERCPEIDI